MTRHARELAEYIIDADPNPMEDLRHLIADIIDEWLTTNNYEINETPPSTIAPPSPPAPNAWPNLTPGAWTVENVKQIMPEVQMVIPGEDGQWAAELSQDPDDPDKAIVTVTTTDILLVPWVNVAAAINANRPLTESDEFDMAPT